MKDQNVTLREIFYSDIDPVEWGNKFDDDEKYEVEIVKKGQYNVNGKDIEFNAGDIVKIRGGVLFVNDKEVV